MNICYNTMTMSTHFKFGVHLTTCDKLIQAHKCLDLCFHKRSIKNWNTNGQNLHKKSQVFETCYYSWFNSSAQVLEKDSDYFTVTLSPFFISCESFLNRYFRMLIRSRVNFFRSLVTQDFYSVRRHFQLSDFLMRLCIPYAKSISSRHIGFTTLH